MNPFKPLFTLGLAVASIGLSLGQAPKKAPAPTVLVQKAKSIEGKISRNYIGRTEAIDSVNIQPRVSGNIIKQLFKEGDLIEKGQKLYQLEDTQYKANVQTAQAKIAEIDAKLEYAHNTHKRYSNLAKTNSVSKDTADNTQSAVHALESEKIAAQAALTIATDNLNYTEIKSPLSGRIGRVSQSEGNYITPQSGPLATITNLNEVYVRFPLSERDFLSLFGSAEELKNNAVIAVILPNGEPLGTLAKVDFIDNKVQSDTDTLNVWVKVDNKDEALHPGSIVTISLSKKNQEAINAVDISAVMHDEVCSFIYVLKPDNTVEKRSVKLGNLSGNTQGIREGLNANETVIIDGMHKVKPGEKVTPIETH